MSMRLEIFGMTDVGMVRDHNEDNFVICKDIKRKDWSYARDEEIDLGPWGSLLVVADGMGGTNAGEVASHIAQEVVRQKFDALESIPKDDKKREQLLKSVIREAHDEIVRHQQKNLETAGMGTTLVIAWLIDDKLHVAWSGDSRCYIHRKGEPLEPFTEDHSLVWGLVKAGEITAEEARTHNESNIITQSLGEPSRPPKPTAKTAVLRPGDQVLVCSDGLNGMLSDEQIGYYLDQDKSVADICNDLTAAANQAGGTDNITVLMARVLGEGKMTAKATMAGLKRQEAKNKEGSATGSGRTEVLRKKLKTRNYFLFGALLIILFLLAKFFYFDQSEVKNIIRVNLESKSYAFEPNVPDTLSLSGLLLNRPMKMDSFRVQGIDYKKVNSDGDISFNFDAQSEPTARVFLYPKASDTLYFGKIRFLESSGKSTPAHSNNQQMLPGEDQVEEAPEPSGGSETVKEDSVEQNTISPTDSSNMEVIPADTGRGEVQKPKPVQQDSVNTPELPKKDTVNTGLPPLNKIEEESDTTKDNNH